MYIKSTPIVVVTVPGEWAHHSKCYWERVWPGISPWQWWWWCYASPFHRSGAILRLCVTLKMQRYGHRAQDSKKCSESVWASASNTNNNNIIIRLSTIIINPPSLTSHTPTHTALHCKYPTIKLQLTKRRRIKSQSFSLSNKEMLFAALSTTSQPPTASMPDHQYSIIRDKQYHQPPSFTSHKHCKLWLLYLEDGKIQMNRESFLTTKDFQLSGDLTVFIVKTH